MPFSPIDPVDEQRALADVQYTLSQEEQTQRLVNPDIASRVSNIYRQAPYIPASVVIALAKGGASPDAVNKTAELAAKQLIQKKPKKQSWFERNVYGNLKETARWSAAALNLAPDLAQNVASQLFNPANPDGFDGWFKSTQLGTMLANSGEAGDGFFIGGEAALTQAERARQFRGTVDGTGSAWTIGRGAASLAFKPGSKAYNILSGFVDAAVTIAADPSGPLGTKLRNVESVSEVLPYALKTKDARRAINLIPGVAGNDLSMASKVADAVKANAGLSLTDDIAFDQTKFGQWATTNKRAVRLTNMIAEVGASDLSEEAKTFRILEMFRQGDTYGIDIDTATAFAKAQNDIQVRAVLGVASGRLANNPDDILLPPDIRDIADTSWFNENLSRVPGYRSLKNSKWLSQVPDNAIVVNGTGRDKAKAVRTYANYLRGMGIEDVENHPVMTQVIKAVRMDSPADAKEALDTAFTQTVEEVLTRAGWDGESARDAMKVLRNNLNESRAYNVSRLGEADDGGFIQALRDSGILPDKVLDGLTPENWDKLVVKGPGAINELLDQVQVLPDYRMLRAAAQNPFLNRARIAYTKSGDRRRASALVEFVQQDLWKPLALATGGYIMRNMMDAQVRIAMSGQKGLFNHPFQFIMYAMGRRGVGDIEGATLAAGKKSIDEFLADPPDDMKAFVEALQFGVYRNLEDSRVSLRRLVRNGNFSIADRGLDAEAHTTGYVDNLAQIHDDSVLRRIARLASFSPEERQRRVTQWLNSAEGANDRTRLRRYFENGIRVGSSDGTGTDKLIRFTPEQLDDPGFLADWVGKISESKVQSIVNGDEDLRIVAAHNRVPFYTLSEKGQAKIPADRVLLDEGDLDITDMVDGLPDEIGSIIRFDNKVIDLPKGSEGVIVGKRYLTDANGNNVLGFDGEPILQNVIAPVFPGPAFTNDYIGSDALRELIDMKGQMGKLAPKVKRAERGLPGQDLNKWGQLGEQWNKATDKFFKGLYGTATQVLEKSPLFRQLYYRTVVENADLLAREQADMLRANIKAFADQAGMSPEKYVGDKNVWRRLEQLIPDAANDGTITQLDQFAKASALYEMQNVLFSASQRNNLEDVLRVVIPFGPAWREVLGTYASAVIEDPTRLRKAQLIFQGAQKFDPDGDGQGFFYKDPTTGEYSFNFPLSGQIAELITGQQVPLQAPVKRLSIGLGIIPSIGPVAQLAADTIIPDTPSTDKIVEILMPYGRGRGFNIVPLWAQRMYDVYRADTENTATVYGNTYIETMRALAATGDYDLSNPDEQQKLYADAKSKARWLAGMRVLGQFIGPTSPSPEFKITTKNGDMYASALIKELYKLQDPNSIGADGQPGNYDTAVARFLEIFGNDAFVYLSSKSEAVKGGLEATDVFSDWERTHDGLMNKYPDVAGFLAPGGSDFAFNVWQRQLRTGARRRLTDKEIVEQAQYRIASAHYRALRAKLPANPTRDQTNWLRKWRIELNKQYPGFPAVAEFNPGEYPKQIIQLKQMVADPDTQDNEVADALRTYLDARDKAVTRYVASGGAEAGLARADKAAPLREWLNKLGTGLAEQVPEFSRIWERLLSNEVQL